MVSMPHFSDEVRYLPWVGDEYEHQSVRWLILGESNYGVGVHERDAVRDLIRAHFKESSGIMDNGRYRICRASERLLHGDISEAAAIRRFWQRHAYYNYVCESMPERAVRPTPKQFRESLPALSEVLCTLRPDVVLVLGIQLWGALPGERDGWEKGDDIAQIVMPRYPKRMLNIWTGKAAHGSMQHTFKCFPVAHPASRGFNAQDWKAWMSAAKSALPLATVNQE